MSQHSPRLHVLLLGGSGQVGRAVQAACPTMNLSLLSRADLDLSRPGAVRGAFTSRFDIVVNAAAYTAVDDAEANQATAWAINCEGAAALAEQCAKVKVPLIQLSTDYVFDGNKAAGYVEDDRPNPLNVYGASKLAGETAIRAALPQHLILRTSWVFGPHRGNFVKAIVARALAGSELRVVADQCGSPTPAAAIAQAIRALIERAAERQLTWGTYHYAGADPVSRYDFAAEILAMLRRQGQAVPALISIPSSEVKSPARRPANSALASSRFAAEFGMMPPNWRQALVDTVAALRRERCA